MMRYILLLIIVYLFSSGCLLAQLNDEELLTQIEQFELNGNKQQAASLLNKLAFYYWESDLLNESIHAFEQSIVHNKSIGNENALKVIYTNMGMIYTDLGQPETAIVFFRKSLLISKDQNRIKDVGTNLLNISVALLSLNRQEEAIINIEEAIVLFQQLKDNKLLQLSYGYLTEIYEDLGQSKKSMEYFNLFSALLKDNQKIEIEETNQKAKQKVAQSEQKVKIAVREKKITEGKLEVTKDSLKVAEEVNVQNKMKIDLQTAQLKSQRLLNMIFISGTVFFAVILLLILYGYRQKKKHNEILEKQNEEINKQNEQIKNKNKKINQSINYARNIQGALLPELNQFNDLFAESFIMFDPRDVVSGDFYWFTSSAINEKVPKGLKIFAAVDCTGHGVPGAFMSMLGLSFLEEIVYDKQIFEPVLILEEMHQMIKTSLKQDHSGNTDGMDMALCVLDEEKKQVCFSGAVNPLIYMQNNEMHIAKAEFFGIGGLMKGDGRKFSQQTIDVSIPTTGYIFSDGFADQFGGPKGQKFFSKNFKKLLFEIHTKPLKEQKNILEHTFNEWIGTNHNRLDDVLVMGFKI